ncbi:MAG: hypothetical protein MR424_02720 [Treponema sp.]|nr:hypothetical protein [Treponema sp.]MCI7565440.1 hypothetical protein [Treponema sp.]
MKALVISDNQEIVDSLQRYLKENNFDIIIYRWLLKALDNIEEIHPDIIFVSACEYPRHWKTLASFVKSGIGGNNIKLFLYDPVPLSEEEVKKAHELGVQALINNLSDLELRKIGSNIINTGLNDNSITTNDKNNKEDKDDEVSFASNEDSNKYVDYELILTHPLTGKFVFASAIYNSDKDNYECKLNLEDLAANQTIKYVSVLDKVDNEIKSFSANIIQNFPENQKLILKASKYYGQEI